MSYIEEFERDFRALIEELVPGLSDATKDTLTIFARGKVAASYKNGMQATARIRAARKSELSGT